MNLVIILSLIAFSSGAQLNRAYLPPDHAQSSDGSDFIETPIIVPDQEVTHPSVAELTSAHADNQAAIDEYVQIGNQGHRVYQNIEGLHEVQETNHGQHAHVFEQGPERSQAALERHAGILRQQFDNNVESYSYLFETENGIYGEESGVATDGVKVHGEYSYTGDDGKQYSVKYTADENGFRPEGDHLPTPPPIPEEILKSLEDNARDEAAGIYNDGSYNDEMYGDKTEHKNNEHAHSETINESENAVNEADAIITDSAVLSEPVIPTVGITENNDLHTIAHIPEPIVPHVNRVYLPPTNHQIIRERIHNDNLERFIKGNDVRKTYLPPTHQQIIEERVSLSSIANQAIKNNGARTYLPPVNNQAFYVARKVYLPPVRQQAIEDKTSQSGIIGENNGVRKTYLPPTQRQVQDTISQNSFSRQANYEARKTYLPPVNGQVTENRQSQINQEQATLGNSARTYLPPSKQIFEDRPSQIRRLPFGTRNRQPSFDSKSGYQY